MRLQIAKLFLIVNKFVEHVGVDRAITVESLFEPRLNIQLGTAYFKDQMQKYGRIEYVAAAYNAGPGRVVQWRASLPLLGSSAIVRAPRSVLSVCTTVSFSGDSSLAIVVTPSPHDANTS